ncbi:hypothetical protein O6H91_09G092700 [Diphasiastrum complanatum]|uniref:Uncharacterized protein n=1 Tax=Diphasiastrum complanatum TaxID=34168 RepID=A0ACC2CS36_DIPCM|nr:hypothetical protein O6H91_09G092700 [Diphasiastrum complanatum]
MHETSFSLPLPQRTPHICSAMASIMPHLGKRLLAAPDSAWQFNVGSGARLGSVRLPTSSSFGSEMAVRLIGTGNNSHWKAFGTRHSYRSGAQALITCSATLSNVNLLAVEKIDFKKLQNGSDIRGVAIPGVEGEPVNLTESATEAIAAAFSQWLFDKTDDGSRRLRIAVGHDSRISANMLQSAVARGIAGAGSDVVLYGLASTPAMFNSTITQREDFFCPVDGSIMITASHLPFNRNGLKFFTNAGGLGKLDITDILSRAAKIYNKFSEENLKFTSEAAEKVIKRVNYMEQYTSDLVGAVRRGARGEERPLEGFHIIVDAGNGAGGFFAGSVLEPLGAVTKGSQFLEPDGLFPNHIPNPEDKKAMDAITKAVINQKADLGIIFDTDVDRAAAVDSNGQELNRNRLIALLSAIVLAEDAAGEETHLAIETSGHGALKENHWLDDGAYLMVKLLIKLAAAKVAGETKGSSVLSNLIGELKEAEFATELRLKIDESHPDVGARTFRDYGEEVLKQLEQRVASDHVLTKAPVNYEGVRVSGYGGWFLLRLSLHDPVLPLNIEAPSKAAAVQLGNAVLAVVKNFEALDTTALQKFVETPE